MSNNALRATDATPSNFAPFGQVVLPGGPGTEGLDLSEGAPRLYLMHLKQRGRRFTRIARHRRVTQCLGALGGKTWFLGVAEPRGVDDPDALPDPARIVGFRIPGDRFVRLHRGTWHAGPHFDGSEAVFYNLELEDTNETDFHAVDLETRFGVSFEFVD